MSMRGLAEPPATPLASVNCWTRCVPFCAGERALSTRGLSCFCKEWWWVRVLPPPGTLIYIRPRCTAGATHECAGSYYRIAVHIERISQARLKSTQPAKGLQVQVRAHLHARMKNCSE